MNQVPGGIQLLEITIVVTSERFTRPPRLRTVKHLGIVCLEVKTPTDSYPSQPAVTLHTHVWTRLAKRQGIVSAEISNSQKLPEMWSMDK